MNQEGLRYPCITDSVLLQSGKVSITEQGHKLTSFAKESARTEQKEQIKLSLQGATFYPDNSLTAFTVAALTRQTV